jgi:arylsulfatase A-like enzyme
VKRKNILFIVMDQFRADLLFGDLAEAAELPHINALMQDATSFRNHWSVVNPCGPSRASLLTGQYAMNHRSVRNGTPLDQMIPTVPVEMRKAGYNPMLFGYTDTPGDPRMLPADDPALRCYEAPMVGFDEKVEMRFEESLPWREFLAANGYDVPSFDKFFVPQGSDLDGPTFYAKEHSDTAFLTDECLKTLGTMKDKSWFAHLTYIRPHPPFVAPEPYNRLCKGKDIPDPCPLDPEIVQHPLMIEANARAPITRFIQGWPDLADTPENVRTIRQVYLGMAAEVDTHVGRMIDFLKESGQYDDTLIVLCSDHGEMLGDHGGWGKSTVFDAAFRVPLIIRVPGGKCAGQVIDAPTETIDIFPTLLEFAGLETPTSVDGRSLYPLMRGQEPEDWRDYTWSELDFGEIPALPPGLPSSTLALEQCNLSILREKHLTLVHFNGGIPPMLFDHRDKGEAKNLANDPAYAGEMLRLTRRMLDHRMTHADGTLSSYAITADGPVRA